MNSADSDMSDISWHARVLDRCDTILQGLAEAMGSLKQAGRPCQKDSARVRIFEESLQQMGTAHKTIWP